MTLFGGGGNRVTVEIVGDAQKLKSEVTQAQGMVGGLRQAASNDFKLLGSAALAAAAGVGAIGAVVGGMAVKGGVDRLMGLERADRMLKQLNVGTGDSKRLMDSLLQTLLGTPFALDEGARSLAGFVASGRDLRDVPRLIQQVTDAAAFAQAPLSEIDFIWQRIQTTGRVTNRELRMLAEQNIPVYHQLAAAFGVTAQEVFDMARTGRLSADEFFDAWEAASEGTIANSVKIAGAGKAMGETTAGSFANMRTAASRFGATILSDIFPLAKTVFNAIGEGFDRMGVLGKRALEGLDTAPLEAFISRIPDMMESAAGTIIDVWNATGFLRDRLGDLLRGLTMNEAAFLKLGVAAAVLKRAFDALKAHPVIAALAVTVTTLGYLDAKMKETTESARDLADSWDDLEAAARGAALMDAFGPELLNRMKGLGINLTDLIGGTGSWRDALDKVLAKQADWHSLTNDQIVAYGNLIDLLTPLAEAEQAAADARQEHIISTLGLLDATEDEELALIKNTDARGESAGAVRGHKKAVEEDTEAIKKNSEKMREAVDPVFNLTNKQRDLAEAQKATTEARKKHGDKSPEFQKALQDEVLAWIALEGAQEDVRMAGPKLRADFDLMVAKLKLSKDEADLLWSSIMRMSGLTVDATVRINQVTRGTTGGGFQEFQHGGIHKARPGGRLGIFGEAGSDEATIPLNSEGVAILAAAMAQAMATLTPPAATGNGHGGGPASIIHYYAGTQIGNERILRELQELGRRQ